MMWKRKLTQIPYGFSQFKGHHKFRTTYKIIRTTKMTAPLKNIQALC